MYPKWLGKWVDTAAPSRVNYAVIVVTVSTSAIDGSGPIEERSPGGGDPGATDTIPSVTLPSFDGFSARSGRQSKLSGSFGASS